MFRNSLRPSLVSTMLTIVFLLLGCQDDDPSTPVDPVPDSGIPAVTGLRVVLDTATGTATLSWNSSTYGKLEDYIVYRLTINDDAPAFAPVLGRTRDTVFVDSLRNQIEEDDFRVQYRVRIKDRAENVGLSSEPLELHVPPVGMVRTALTYLREGTREGKASIKDSVRYIVRYDNPTRKIKTLRWSADGYPEIGGTVSPSARKGADTLSLLPKSPLSTLVRIQLIDEAGAETTRAESLIVFADPPVAHPTGRTATRRAPENILHPADTLTLVAGATDGFGHIVKREWDIGNRGTFVEVEKGDTTLLPDSLGFFTREYVLRVTDDDGQVGLDTLVARFMPYRDLQSNGEAHFVQGGPFPFHPAGDFLLSIYPGWNPRVYHLAQNRWSEGPALPRYGSSRNIVTVGDRLFMVGQKVYEYDFGSDDWIPKTDSLETGGGPYAAALDGKIFIFRSSTGLSGSAPCLAYDPVSNTVVKLRDIPLATRTDVVGNLVNALYRMVIPFQGKLYLIRDEFRINSNTTLANPSMAVYDPASDEWRVEPGISLLLSPFGEVFAKHIPGSKKIRILQRDKKIQAYDPGAGNWSMERDLNSILGGVALVSETTVGEDLLYIVRLSPQQVLSINLETGQERILMGAEPRIGYGVSMVVHRNRMYMHSRTPRFLELELNPGQ